jgi:hypothetical protein
MTWLCPAIGLIRLAGGQRQYADLLVLPVLRHAGLWQSSARMHLKTVRFGVLDQPHGLRRRW